MVSSAKDVSHVDPIGVRVLKINLQIEDRRSAREAHRRLAEQFNRYNYVALLVSLTLAAIFIVCLAACSQSWLWMMLGVPSILMSYGFALNVPPQPSEAQNEREHALSIETEIARLEHKRDELLGRSTPPSAKTQPATSQPAKSLKATAPFVPWQPLSGASKICGGCARSVPAEAFLCMYCGTSF